VCVCVCVCVLVRASMHDWGWLPWLSSAVSGTKSIIVSASDFRKHRSVINIYIHLYIYNTRGRFHNGFLRVTLSYSAVLDECREGNTIVIRSVYDIKVLVNIYQVPYML